MTPGPPPRGLMRDGGGGGVIENAPPGRCSPPMPLPVLPAEPGPLRRVDRTTTRSFPEREAARAETGTGERMTSHDEFVGRGQETRRRGAPSASRSGRRGPARGCRRHGPAAIRLGAVAAAHPDGAPDGEAH